MGTHNVFDNNQCGCGPINDPIVDKLLGNAYQVVKYVAMNMPAIKSVSDELASILAVFGKLKEINDVALKLPELLDIQADLPKLEALYNNLNQLITLYTHIDELVKVSTGIDDIKTIIPHLQEISVVAANIADISSVGKNITKVVAVANNLVAINKLAPLTTEIDVLADNVQALANINTHLAELLNINHHLPDLLNIETPLSKLVINSFEALRRTYAEVGLHLVQGSFEDGATLTDSQDVLLQRSTGKCFNWQAALPVDGKVIPTGSTPESTGGIGIDKWQDVTNTTQYSQAQYSDGVEYKTYYAWQGNVTLQHKDEAVQFKYGGTFYRWDGAFPQGGLSIPQNTPEPSPAQTGAGKYIAVLDLAIKDLYAQPFGSSKIGFIQAGQGALPRTAQDKMREVVSVKDFGAKGDGFSDDTAAITEAINSEHGTIIFPDGEYCVTSLLWRVSGKTIVFSGGAFLVGVSTQKVDQLLELRDFRHSVIENLQMSFDGNESSPSYMPNYGCGLRITSTSGSSPSQFFTIDGLYIKYIKTGLVSGNLEGNPPQQSFPQSEIFIRNYKVRGVMQQLYQNAINSYITTSGCVYVTQKFEATGWWDDSKCYNIRSDITNGAVVSVGDEFQAARKLGYNLYGSNIYISDPVFEQSCTNYITGNVRISGITNGYFGSGELPLFTVASGSVGRMLLSDFNVRRPKGTASSSRSLLINAIGSPDYKVDLVDSVISEFAYVANASNALLVSGCVVHYRNLEIDNTSSTVNSWFLNDAMIHNLGFDGSGESMPEVIDSNPKAGWTQQGTLGGFGRQTSGAPSGRSGYIRITTTGSTTTIATPTGTSANRINGGKDVLMSAILKKIGAVSNFTIQLVFYDFSGSQISTQTVMAMDDARLIANGFNNWQPFSAPVKSPVNAVYASIKIQPGSTCDVGITGILLSQ